MLIGIMIVCNGPIVVMGLCVVGFSGISINVMNKIVIETIT